MTTVHLRRTVGTGAAHLRPVAPPPGGATGMQEPGHPPEAADALAYARVGRPAPLHLSAAALALLTTAFLLAPEVDGPRTSVSPHDRSKTYSVLIRTLS